jgi:putative transposase
MLVNQAYRYELKPNNKQQTLLYKSCGVARFAWNWGLTRRIELYKTKKFITFISQNNELNSIKKTEYPWMYEVSKWIPSEALRDLDNAYFNFIYGMKNHKDVGLPRFKNKKTNNHFRIINGDFNRQIQTIAIKNNFIRISKIGYIYTKESTVKLQGKILSATVSREADRWFCSLNVEIEKTEPQPIQGDIIGIDLGIKTFATVSNGKETYDLISPKPLKKKLIKIKRLHRQLSRKQNKSKNRAKARLRLARLYHKTRNIRKDFLSKESSRLAKTKSVICIEDLNVKGMIRNHHLARSIGDEGWGEFKRMLEYKTKWYGSRLIKINRFESSSKTCSECGKTNHELKLSDRKWVCLKCGMLHNRDENAAKNIRQSGIGILNTESSPGINAYGVGVRPQLNEAVHSEVGSKQLPNTEDKSYRTD